MGKMMQLTAADGHELDAYRAEPSASALGGIVVLQEIFGVNAHIRAVSDKFAGAGYAALAPALFDRIERNVELGYDDEAVAIGRRLRGALDLDAVMCDIAAAIAALRPRGRVGVVGFCWGGSLAWLAACRLDPDCAICYYGAQIVDFAGEKPRCPVIIHFGEKDPLIPAEAAAAIRKAHAAVPAFTYPAGHGFNCDQRGDYHAPSAALAWQRSLAHLRSHID